VAGKEHENGQQNQNRHCNRDAGGRGDAAWDPGAAALALVGSLLSGDAFTLEELPRHFLGRYHAP